MRGGGYSPELGFLNSEELSLIKSSPLPAQLPGRGGVNSTRLFIPMNGFINLASGASSALTQIVHYSLPIILFSFLSSTVQYNSVQLVKCCYFFTLKISERHRKVCALLFFFKSYLKQKLID